MSGCIVSVRCSVPYVRKRVGLKPDLRGHGGDLRGEKVGQVSHTRNTEYVFVAGPSDRVESALAAVAEPVPAGSPA